MKQIKIKLETINDVKKFVDKAGKCDFDIDIFYNHVLIDAKSLMGVLGLDLNYILTVQLHGVNWEFETFLREFTSEEISENRFGRAYAKAEE